MSIDNNFSSLDRTPSISPAGEKTSLSRTTPEPLTNLLLSPNTEVSKTGNYSALPFRGSFSEECALLEQQAQKIENQVNAVSNFDLKHGKSFQSFIDKNGEDLINQLIEQLKLVVEEPTFAESVESVTVTDPYTIPFLEALELLALQSATNVDYGLLAGEMNFSDLWTTAGSTAQLGIFLANSLGQGGVLIVMNLLTRKAEQILIEKKEFYLKQGKENPSLKNEIDILEKWINQQKLLLKKESKKGILFTSIIIPKAVATLLDLANLATSNAGVVFNWLVGGVALLTSALQLRRAQKHLQEQSVWIATFKNTFSPGKVDEIIKKQKKAYEDQLEKTKSVQIIEEKESLSVSLRNALKIFIAKKHEIDRGFLKLNLNKAVFSFTSTSIITALAIVLKVLVVTGISVVTGAAIASGYGLIAVAIILLVIGLGYFYYKKPNLFRTYLQGIQAELALKKIPLMFQKFRRQYALFEASHASQSADVIRSRLLELKKMQNRELNEQNLPHVLRKRLSLIKKKQGLLNPQQIKEILETYCGELSEKLNKKQEKIDSINRKIQALQKSVEKQETKLEELQVKIRDASWKDYQRLLYPKSKKNVDHSDEDAAVIFAECILKDEEILVDPEIKLLFQHMNIDLRAILSLANSELKTSELVKAIQSYFAMDQAETLVFMRNRIQISK